MHAWKTESRELSQSVPCFETVIWPANLLIWPMRVKLWNVLRYSSSRPHLSFCARKTAWLAPLSLWVPVLICCFWMQNSDFWTRITSLYGSQIPPIVLCMQNSVSSIRITGLYGFQPSSVVLCMQNSDFMTWLTSLYVYQTSFEVLSTHNSVLSTRIKKTILVPAITCGFVHAKQRL